MVQVTTSMDVIGNIKNPLTATPQEIQAATDADR